MEKCVIIGLGAFGVRMLEELQHFTDQIIIIDKDPNLIEKYGEKAKKSLIIDVNDERTLQKSIPQGFDAAVVDLGGKIELSIMVTTYLKKMGMKEIIVKAENDQHEAVLTTVGATNVIFPDREAAKRVIPMLASSLLFNFMPISDHLALAEVGVNADYIGKSLLEADLRKNIGVNVVAVRKQNSESFDFVNDPNYCFTEADILLIAGTQEAIFTFSNHKHENKKNGVAGLFRTLFPRKTSG